MAAPTRPEAPAGATSSDLFLNQSGKRLRTLEAAPLAMSDQMPAGATESMRALTGVSSRSVTAPMGSARKSATPLATSLNQPTMPPSEKRATPPPENPAAGNPGLPPGRRREAA